MRRGKLLLKVLYVITAIGIGLSIYACFDATVGSLVGAIALVAAIIIFKLNPNDNNKREDKNVEKPFNLKKPPLPCFYFTGRKEILKELHKRFFTKRNNPSVKIQVITGLGGVGKSEIAKEYASRYGNKYKYIWWINAETQASINNAYISFAQKNKLGLPDDKLETIIHSVKDWWMQQNEKWLFIYDNAENKKIIDYYCPSPCKQGQHVLVTSRNVQFLGYESINIGVFTETEACEFIEKYTNKPVDEHFKELAKKMDYLPLALDQAGAYMKINEKSYEGYLDLYKKYNLKLLTKYNDDKGKKTITTTWLISFDKINNPASKQLLNLFAFFAPDNIRCEWFSIASGVFPKSLQKVVSNELKYNEAIAELTKYSLVSLNEGIINIHRLVQEVIRNSLKQKHVEEWRNCCVNILNEFCYTDFSTAESRTRFSSLVPHIISVTSEINDENATKEVASLYFFLGDGFDELADYSQSLTWYKKSLDIRENVLGKDHPDTAATYNNIGLVYCNKGDYDKALEYYGKALDIFENVLGKDHPNTAATYNNIAEVYCNKGDYDEALEYYGKALDTQEKVLGKNHPSTATTYNNIATVYHNKGDYDKALEYFGKALDIRENVLGKDHPSTATTYNNIACVYHAQKLYDRALVLFLKALRVYRKVLGEEHHYTKEVLDNIADTYAETTNPVPFDKWIEQYLP